MSKLERLVGKAVQQFWRARASQKNKQGASGGVKDAGDRGATTGGKQMDGFIDLIRALIVDAGASEEGVFVAGDSTTLPGYFRPTKRWDLLAFVNDRLIAAIEFKSQVGPSFGNSFNNRVEEALGGATDVWTAFREGAFSVSDRPWLGYFMHLELAQGSTRDVQVAEPHFEVFPEFKKASYLKRYELFCERIVRERLYDAACLLASDRTTGKRGKYATPSSELGLDKFRNALEGRIHAALR